ncbi:hypothetical protein Ahy_A07g036243 [Arachis hypogaea]|uniref:CCHC-type domain-containing protein n=1 Tax=Arachis hypogaea TaxID=3818 RepID=A0A445CFL0_ARAHY|nr:hypothetical protein Ahy_A07g036243 [Arachis hypogaea]
MRGGGGAWRCGELARRRRSKATRRASKEEEQNGRRRRTKNEGEVRVVPGGSRLSFMIVLSLMQRSSSRGVVVGSLLDIPSLMDVPQVDDVVNIMCEDGVGDTDVVDYGDVVEHYGDVVELTEDDILRKVFRSEDDAYEFYKKLGKFYGFGIRRGDMFKDEEAQIEGFQGCGISTSKTMRYMAGISGGYSLVRFLKKDAYNYVDKRRRARIADGDTNAAIVYLEDFEAEWAQAEADFGLKDAMWWNQVYGKKEMWANAFLCEKFCAGYRTTSRCEGINFVCKNFLESKHSMLDLVQNLELLVREYKNNELLAQFRSIYSVPVMTTSLESLERYAASLYTRAIFGDVKKEIESVTSVNFVGVRRLLTTKVYTVEEYGHPSRNIMVLCDKNMGKLECRCAQKISLYTITLEGIRSLCATLESEFTKGVHATNSNTCGEIRDPIVVRTKGAPKRQKRKASKRKCAKCNKPGHTKRTCREGRPRNGKRPREDELDLDQANEGQRDECANLDVIGSDDQKIGEEEGFGGRSVGCPG